MSSDSRAEILDTHAGGISMRLWKYIPSASTAILLLATFAASPVFAQSPLAVALANSGGGVIDYGGTGYLRIRPSIPMGQGDAHNVAIRGVFTPVATHPMTNAPSATLVGPAAGSFGANCASPDPAAPTNPSTFACFYTSILSGQTAGTGNPYERRIVISQPAPAQRPPNSACPPDGLAEHVGNWVITITGDNITGSPRPPVNFSGHDTEDFA